MEKYLWLIIMIPIDLLFTGLGIFAWKRKKPMWFWSGKTVEEDEISDIPAYNRANGIMWLAYSLIFWIGSFLGFLRVEIAGIVVGVGSVAGLPFLVCAYKRIYAKYRSKDF